MLIEYELKVHYGECENNAALQCRSRFISPGISIWGFCSHGAFCICSEGNSLLIQFPFNYLLWVSVPAFAISTFQLFVECRSLRWCRLERHSQEELSRMCVRRSRVPWMSFSLHFYPFSLPQRRKTILNFVAHVVPQFVGELVRE